MSERVGQMLGERATAILAAVSDPELAKRLNRALEACSEALGLLDAFDLARYEAQLLSGTRHGPTWGSLAPQVGRILVVMQATHDVLLAAFPTPEEPAPPPQEVDIDQMFDSLTGESGEFGRIDRSKEIDRVVGGSIPVEPVASTERIMRVVGRSIESLTSMLLKDIHDFREQLKIPALLSETWTLLAELHEFRGKCTQCLEAVIAAMIAPFTRESVENLLPRYRSGVTRALVLRSGLVDLAFVVEQRNQFIQTASPEDAVGMWSELLHQLDVFGGSRAYALLRPSDKREVVAFRTYLADWAKRGADVDDLRTRMEGFSRFLDFRRMINRREELVGIDRANLQLAASALTQADVPKALEAACKAYGRSDTLDALIRSANSGTPPALDALRSTVNEALGTVGG